MLGLKVLPKESGNWGILLPLPTEPVLAHAPEVTGAVERIDPAALQFDTTDFDDMNRGYGLVLGLFMALFSTICTLALAPKLFSQDLASIEFVVLPMLLLGLPVAFAFWALRSARAPLREPFILSRKLRKFYVWVDKKQGWRSWDYDSLTPFTQVNRLVTAAGASTVYALRLVVLDQKTRAIKETITPVPVKRTPEACGQMWEFIRCYMDGQPQDLPPVRLQPEQGDKAANLVRFDSRFTGVITPDHSFEPGIFPRLFFWFWAIVDYWQMRAMVWIQRKAPRPAHPPELVDTLHWSGPNPYKVIKPNHDEMLARSGSLPDLRRRWLIAGVLATLLYGGLFALMTAGILSSL